MSVAQDRPVEGYILSRSKDELAQDMLQPCGPEFWRDGRQKNPAVTAEGSVTAGAARTANGASERL